jgi:excisionase family DNA binding protein
MGWEGSVSGKETGPVPFGIVCRPSFASMVHKQTPQPHTAIPMTTAEAADLVRVHPRTIRKWNSEGRLAAKRTFPGRGGRLLFDRAEVLAAVGFSEAVSA